MSLPFPFPPATCGLWVHLAEPARREWLGAALEHAQKNMPLLSKEVGRTVVLEGELVDSLSGFFCAIGEAVNGPGGYFGRSFHGFDDCLWGSYGLETPCTIVWRNADVARRVLDSQTLADECRYQLITGGFPDEDGAAWLRETLDLAVRGQRSMFDELAEAISSVTERSHGQKTIRLVLE